MTIYHLSITTVGRAGGALPRSAHHTGGVVKTAGALGKAFYLAGERLVDREGRVVDYRSKAEGVEHVGHILPGGGTFDPQTLWNIADNHPGMNKATAKRPDPKSLAAFDLIVAVPRELKTLEQREAVAKETCRWIADHFRVAVSVGGHIPDIARGSSADNWHFHALISARECTLDGQLGKLQRSLDPVHCRKHGLPVPVEVIRQKWQDIANEHLERAGSAERIDCRTLKAQGIDRAPGKHRGATATKLLREKERTRAGERAPPSAGPTERNAGAAQGAPAVRTVAELRAELAEAARTMAARSKAAGDRIAAIQEQRKPAPLGPAITADIGSVQGWLHHPGAQFIRAWEAADRASALRRKIRAALQAQAVLRAPTKEEAAELRSAGRARTRAEKLSERIAKALDQTARFDPTERITVPEAARSSRQLDEIERAIAGHARRAQEYHAAMEMG